MRIEQIRENKRKDYKTETGEEIMQEKIRYHLRWIINSVILAGVIIFIIGMYYEVVKAGIPYQDPPLELQIKYAINLGIGDILVRNGFVIAVCGGIIRLIFGLLCKKCHAF